MKHVLLFLYTDGLIHPGGASSHGLVDLPIQREATSGLPVIWGQTLKGALRDRAGSQWDETEVSDVFGQRVNDADDGAGELTPGKVSIGDGMLVAFPTPTTRRTFAWLTSPLVLSRLARKRAIAAASLADLRVTVVPGEDDVYGTQDWGGRVAIGEEIVKVKTNFEGLAGIASGMARRALAAEPLAFVREKLKADLLLSSDERLQSATHSFAEILYRIQLKEDSKNVNNLWVEEYVPGETLFVSLLSQLDDNGDALDRIVELVHGSAIRIGGDETVGKGLVWCSAHPEPKSGEADVAA